MKNTWLWLIIGIVLIAAIGKNTELFSSINDRFPNEIFYEKSVKLSQSGSITLPEGIKTENVRKIEISVSGCGEDLGEAYLNEEKIGTYSFSDCDSLNYADGSGKPYIHYQTKTFTKYYYNVPSAPLLTSNKLTYSFTRKDKDITRLDMAIFEKVECITNSQCVKSAPYCDAIQHQCMPQVKYCTTEYAPVCGENGISYINGCFSALSGHSIIHKGLCGGDSSAEDNLGCNYLYYFDDNKRCEYKQFCGTFMYQGLYTFNSEKECTNKLEEIYGVKQEGFKITNTMWIILAGIIGLFIFKKITEGGN